MKRRIGRAGLALLLLLLLAGCAAGSGMDGETAAQGIGSAAAPGEAPQADAAEQSTADSNVSLAPQADAEEMLSGRKVIQNADFSLETLEYEETVDAIQALVSASGGYVERSSTEGSGVLDGGSGWRCASFTVRVPAAGLTEFSEALGECGSVTNSSFYTNEVTDYYYDTEAHLKSLQLQEERLLEILSKATQLEEVITLETSLADVRYQIESLQGTLRRLDSQVELSTVNIFVQEVSEYSPGQSRPRSLGQRIAAEFSESMQSLRRAGENFLVFFLGNIVSIAVWAAVLVCVVVLVRRRLKKRAAKGPGKPSGDTPEKPEK